jgi:DNA polymerase-4
MLGNAVASCPTCGSGRLVSHAELRDLGIAHIDCDAFYASVEKRDDPSLEDRPLIVGHTGGRGVVTTACYLARISGVRSAMPMFQALELCPDAVVLPPDMAKYKRVSMAIRDIFLAATPMVEPVSLDEAYLDLTDAHRTSAPTAAQALALIAQRVETEVGITVSIGLAPNKFLAKLASELQKPAGYSVIGRSEAKAFLATLSVRKIHGVGAATAQRMESDGIRSIADLQAQNPQQLEARYGKFGRRLARFVQGDDERSVTPHRPVKSISSETTFRRDTGSAADLIETARELCADVAGALERKRLAGGTVVLKMKTSDFRILTRNRRLVHPTQRANVLLEHAASLVEKEADGRTFRLLGVGVADLRPAVEADPADLFAGLETGVEQ